MTTVSINTIEEAESYFQKCLITRQITGKDTEFFSVILNDLRIFRENSNVVKDVIEKVASENADIAELSADVDRLNEAITKTLIYTAGKMKDSNGKDVYVSVKGYKDIIVNMLNAAIAKEPYTDGYTDMYFKHMAVEGIIYRLYDNYKILLSHIVDYENRRKYSNLIR